MQIIHADVSLVEQVAPLFDRYRQFYGQPSDLNRAKDFLRDRLTQSESVMFVAMAETALGFTQLYPSFSSVSLQRIWILNDLFVLPEARNQGIGMALLERAKAWGIETQAKRISLRTAVDNVAAQTLYQKAGYLKDNAFWQYDLDLSQ
ncbi:GNAT family N-acetyltransferase [Microcoleus sp. FACHB-1515]|uniref:GNAT family N-acetyltransferase n=1 Tax=Cyanophyceae TaxID=3028117 RepID=UPI001682BAFF|nr:GNAT family N-acetyltransferase [Microcoleus sp. FACHB-1515]MBD2088511.1 GNAT family N-acetyltransferase [Microcoleus sp. FACHB-1515]